MCYGMSLPDGRRCPDQHPYSGECKRAFPGCTVTEAEASTSLAPWPEHDEFEPITARADRPDAYRS